MKNILKRATGLLLATGMVLALAACGPKPTDPGAETTPGTDPTPSAEKVVYSNGGPEEFFETPRRFFLT